MRILPLERTYANPKRKMPFSKEMLIHVSNALQLLQNTLKCAICLELLREPVSTRCGHHFCNLCITNLITHRKNGRTSCPLCNSVINRRSIQVNGKIKQQVDKVVQLVKAVEADTQMEILKVKCTPNSTNEANSSRDTAAAGLSSRSKEKLHAKDSLKAADNITSESSSPKISSAEKVKTWLLQNEEGFGYKTMLNACSMSSIPPPPCEEDSDTDMVSVSQVVNESHAEISNPRQADKSIIKENEIKPVRRSLNIRQIKRISKITRDDAFDKLLDGNVSMTVSSTKPSLRDSSSGKTIHTGSKEIPIAVTNMDLYEPVSPVDDEVPAKNKQDRPDIPIHGESTTNSDKTTSPQNEANSYIKRFREEVSMKALKKLDSCTASGVRREAPSSQSSIPDSCEIIPPSIVAAEIPLARPPLGHRKSAIFASRRTDSVTEPRSTPASAPKSRLITPKVQMDLNFSLRTNLSGDKRSCASGVAFLKAGRFCQSGRSKVRFFQRGKLLRERRYVPLYVLNYIRFDKPVLWSDTSKSDTPIIPSESTEDLPTSTVRKDCCSVGVQTLPPEAAHGSSQADDNESEELFPETPRRLGATGGEIVTRRSNSSSVSDGIMDAETVLFTQPPTAQTPATSKTQTDREESVPLVRSNLSESLLSRAAEAPRKSGSDEDEDDDFPRVKKRRRAMLRSRALSSSDDSDTGARKIRKKEKTRNTSPHSIKIDCPGVQDLLTDLLDQSLESPKRLVRDIKAKMEADMQEKFGGSASRRCSPRTQKSTKPVDVDLATPPRKRMSIYSDQSDNDILEGTPQRNPRRSLKSAKSAEKSFSESSRKSPNITKQTSDSGAQGSFSPNFVEPTAQDSPSRRSANTSFRSLDVSVRNAVEACEEDSLLPHTILEHPSKRTGDLSQQNKIHDEDNFAKPASVPKKTGSTPQRSLREKNVTTKSPRSSKKPSHTQNNSQRLNEKCDSQNTPSKGQNNPHMEKIPLNNLSSQLNVRQSSTPSIATVQASTPGVTKAPVKLCFVCSGLGGNLPFQVKKFAGMVGAEFSTAFDPKVTTHLIVRTKANGTTDKTLKYLQAVASKKWVVSIQWILEGLKQEKLLPEEDFEVFDTSGLDGPRRSRLSPKRLFSNFEFCCFSPFSDLTKEQLEELVELCGATVISDPKKFSFKPDVLPLCLAQWDDEREQEYLGWIDRYCVPLVQHDWLMDCIGRFSIVSFWSLLMSDVSDESLRTMGYPPELIEHPPSDSTEME